MLRSVQLLRAVAALGVVFTHYNFYGLDTGGFGVDIFFIISGFIISYVVNKTTEDFMMKRVIRVVPLYYIATIITIAMFMAMPQYFKHVIVNTEALIKSFLFIPYRIDGSGPILSLGWTLNNEMFFYVTMFICIALFRKQKYIVPACGALLILFLVILNISGTNNYILNFYGKGLLPEFIFGLGMYYFWNYYKNNKLKWVTNLMVLLGALSIIFMVYCDITETFSDVSRNIIRGIPSLLFVNAFLVLEDKINKDSKLVKLGLKLGDASYVMYLFHPFIILPLKRIVYRHLTIGSGIFIVELVKMLIALALVCVVSVVIYYLIDKPIIDRFKKSAKATAR